MGRGAGCPASGSGLAPVCVIGGCCWSGRVRGWPLVRTFGVVAGSFRMAVAGQLVVPGVQVVLGRVVAVPSRVVVVARQVQGQGEGHQARKARAVVEGIRPRAMTRKGSGAEAGEVRRRDRGPPVSASTGAGDFVAGPEVAERRLAAALHLGACSSVRSRDLDIVSRVPRGVGAPPVRIGRPSVVVSGP